MLHETIAGPPAEERIWRRFVGLVESGVEIADALVVVLHEHGPNARRTVHARLRSVVLAMGRELEVSGCTPPRTSRRASARAVGATTRSCAERTFLVPASHRTRQERGRRLMPTTFCTYCERLVRFDPEGTVPLRDHHGEFGPEPPGVAVHAFLDCGHEKNLVTVPPAQEVAA